MSPVASRQPDALLQAALEQYEVAMKFYGQQRFEKAKPLLEKVRDSPYSWLADRATTHWNICNQRLQPLRPPLRTAEDHYTQGIVHLNLSRYEEAEELLQKAQKMDGKSAHIVYALASLHALQNHVEPALAHLKAAIALDPRCRSQARHDDDFRLLMEDPRFTEVLYPERS